MSAKDFFNSKGVLHCKNLVPLEVSMFVTHLLTIKGAMGVGGDTSVPNSKAAGYCEIATETIMEMVWPILEDALEEKLIPTYSYARLYGNGNELKIHSDRPSCEISVTIQLGRSHHYSWPIYMAGHRFDLAEGDGVMYKGCDLLHWRKPCDGPDDYYSGQVFCHFVRANGPFTKFAGDERWSGQHPFVRNRMTDMYRK